MDARTSWPALIGALIRREQLSADETAWAMNEIMEGAATPAQIAGFGVALRMKGETPAEVTGLADSMLAHAAPISVGGRTVDLVGTGGDGARTVNISTMGTIAAAAAGARMVKHGNRAASSACGTADVLEALGVVIDLPPAATEQLIDEIGLSAHAAGQQKFQEQVGKGMFLVHHADHLLPFDPECRAGGDRRSRRHAQPAQACERLLPNEVSRAEQRDGGFFALL